MKKLALLCLILLIAVAVCSLLRGPVLPDREAISAGASVRHWAGTDELGRDRAQRMGTALLLGLVGSALAAFVSTCLTLAAAMVIGFAKKPLREVLLYCSDLFLALPWLFLLMLVRAVLPLSLPGVVSAIVTYSLLAVLGWPVYVRTVSARVATLTLADWFLHARASGLQFGRVLRVHVLPHLWPISMTQFLLCVPLFLIAEANLGSLGLGVSEPLVSWGSLLNDITSGAQRASTSWVYLPLVLLVAMVFSIESLGAEE